LAGCLLEKKTDDLKQKQKEKKEQEEKRKADNPDRRKY